MPETANTAISSDEPRAQRLNILAAARRVANRDSTMTLNDIAAEAGLAPETVTGHFQTAQEIMVALAADDLAAVAHAMHPGGTSEPAAAATDDAASHGPRPGGGLLKRKTMPAPLEQVMKEVAPDASGGGGSPLARIERRIQMLEKAFAEIGERQEKATRERGDTLAAIDSNLMGLGQRLDASETARGEIVAEIKKALLDLHVRVNGLEVAVHPARRDADHGAAVDPAQTLLDFDELQPAPKDDTPRRSALSSDSAAYLAAARRAANEAMTEHADAAPEKAPVKRKRRLFGRMWLLLFACLAPMTIVAMSIGVLNHHRVRAETIHKTVPATAQAGPPAIVGMNAEGPAPSETASASALEDVLEIAKSGDAGAMRDAGLKYLAGDGAERNDAQAARWLLRAAYKGEAVAQYWLGTLYARGQGVPADAEQANHWYEAAAKKGNRRAMHALGVAALEGLGRDKDAREAARRFREAAALGSVDSAFNLAVLYERGDGVTQSLTDAVTWYGIAAASGDAAARSRRNALAARLTPATRALAEQAAESFKPKPADARANVASLSGH